MRIELGLIDRYPKEASVPISYGNSVEVAIGYLSVGQYMSIGENSSVF